MDEVFYLSSQLSEKLMTENDYSVQKSLVFEFLDQIQTINLKLKEFPAGQDWFNTEEELSLKSHLKGKIVVLDFFTYCCINCIHIFPHLKELEENFSVTDGVVVVGIHSAKFDNEKKSKNISAAIKRYEITHPVVNDVQCLLWRRLGISCWPTILVLGPGGEILFSLVGEFNSQVLQMFISCAVEVFAKSLSHTDIPQLKADSITPTVSHNLLFPGKVAICGQRLALSDSGHHRILIIDLKDNHIMFTIGGPAPGFHDGSFTSAKFNTPQGVVFYDTNTVYVADTENHAVRVVCLIAETVKTVIGTGNQGVDLEGGGKGTLQEISSPWDLCIVPAADVTIPPKVAFENSVLPTPIPGIPPLPPPAPILGIPPLPPPAPAFPPPPSSTTGPPQPVVTSKVLLIAMSGTHQIWAYFLEDTQWWKGKRYTKGTCVAVAGNGREENRNSQYPQAAAFAQPSGLAYSEIHKAVLAADSESSCIRKLSLADGTVSAVVGGDATPMNLFSYGDADGSGMDAKLQHPLGVACSEGAIWVADTYNHKLKLVDLQTRHCSTVDLFGEQLNEPGGLCIGQGLIYVADTNNHVVKVVDIKTRRVSELEIRKQEVVAESNEGTREVWVADARVSTRGGTVTAYVNLPPDTHGRWRVSEPGDCVPQLRTGPVDSELVSVSCLVPQGTQPTAMIVEFDLVLCGETTCTFRKCLLKLQLLRGENESDNVSITLVPINK